MGSVTRSGYGELATRQQRGVSAPLSKVSNSTYSRCIPVASNAQRKGPDSSDRKKSNGIANYTAATEVQEGHANVALSFDVRVDETSLSASKFAREAAP